jgi:hypothetical protein
MGKVSHWRSVFGVVYTYLLFVASRTLEPALATSCAYQVNITLISIGLVTIK